MAFRNAAAASASLPALAAASPWAKSAFAAGVPLLSRAVSVVDGQKHAGRQHDCEHGRSRVTHTVSLHVNRIFP